MKKEFDIIEGIQGAFERPEGVSVGIGDDAAVLDRGRFDLMTTDVVVEDVHYRMDWCSPADIGWRALVASLSDIAAMGGRPGPWVMSIGVGPALGDAFVDGVVEGMEAAAERFGGDVETLGAVGGDLSSTGGPSFVSVTLLGETAPGGAVLREGARPGDRIVVTGQPGRAAAGLALLEGTVSLADSAQTDVEALERAYRRPRARSELGWELGRRQMPSALIDVSDGLVADLGHLLQAGGVGGRLELDALPLDADLESLAGEGGDGRERFVLGGGEDFELLAVVPADRLDALEALGDSEGWPLSEIGAILPADEGLSVVDPGGNPVDVSSTAGWEHFSEPEASEA